MELKAAGLDFTSLSEHEEAFLVEHERRKQDIRYQEVLLLVTAIMSAGKIAGGHEMGDSLGTALRQYKNLVFPDVKVDLEDKARRNQEILKREHERGSFEVQTLDYGKSKRKKKKR